MKFTPNASYVYAGDYIGGSAHDPEEHKEHANRPVIEQQFDILSNDMSNSCPIKSSNDSETLSTNKNNGSKPWYENFKNKDGTYSLYDGDRFSDKTPFHEQLFVITPSGPSFDLEKGNVGIGSLSFDVITGGWEWEHFDLSLLDFGHAEAALEIKDFGLKVGAFASIWSPSVSVSFFGIKIELGFEVGAVGAYAEFSPKGVRFGAADTIGFSIKMSW